MTTITFDTLGYFEKLKGAGMPEAQARVHVETMQEMVSAYDSALRKELTNNDAALRKEMSHKEMSHYDESLRKELATKADLQDVYHDLKSDTLAIRAEMKAFATKDELQSVKVDMIKWVVGAAIAQMALMTTLFAYMK